MHGISLHRSESNAREIAEGFLSNSASRGTQCYLDVKYIVSKDSNEADTLAYIYNDFDNKSFVMVSSESCMPPILAFSNDNNLYFEESSEDPLYSSFIENLDKYKAYKMELGSSGYYFKPEHNLFDHMVELCPDTSWHWDQHIEPYTKYIQMEHPKSPVGCVGLATGIIVTYCRDSLTINGKFFDLKAMRNGMLKGVREIPVGPIAGRNDYGESSSTNAWNGDFNFEAVMSYNAAMDSIAKMLYLLGKDLNLIYREPGSDGKPQPTSGFDTNAYNLLKNYGFSVSNNGLQAYNSITAAQCIDRGEIIYASARQRKDGVALNSGHAFIIDGCCYDYDENISNENTSGMKNVFLHCNWGENRGRIGYFSGEVFQLYWHEYYNMKFFSIKNTREFEQN